LVQKLGIRLSQQGVPHGFVREHLGNLGEDLKVLLRGLFRHQEKEQKVDWLAVGRIKGHWGVETNQGSGRVFQTFDPTVWNGNAIAKACRPESLARKKGIEDFCPGNALVVLKQKPSLFEDSLFAAGIKTNHNVGQWY
jgi:hypothetical protein